MTKDQWVRTAIAFMVITALLVVGLVYLASNPHIRFYEVEVPEIKMVEDTITIPKITFEERVVEIPRVAIAEEAVETEAAPETTEAPAPTVETAPQCLIINDYNLLESMDHVSTSGSHIHVEYWWEGQPERETLLPTAGVSGGRYNLTRSLRGHVWEYDGCSDTEVREQIMAHIDRRVAGGANNAGYVKWEPTGLFQPVQ